MAALPTPPEAPVITHGAPRPTSAGPEPAERRAVGAVAGWRPRRRQVVRHGVQGPFGQHEMGGVAAVGHDAECVGAVLAQRILALLAASHVPHESRCSGGDAVAHRPLGTSGPTATTLPAASCPSVIGSVMNGTPPLRSMRSRWQTPHASTSTTTWLPIGSRDRRSPRHHRRVEAQRVQADPFHAITCSRGESKQPIDQPAGLLGAQRRAEQRVEVQRRQDDVEQLGVRGWLLLPRRGAVEHVLQRLLPFQQCRRHLRMGTGAEVDERGSQDQRAERTCEVAGHLLGVRLEVPAQRPGVRDRRTSGHLAATTSLSRPASVSHRR